MTWLKPMPVRTCNRTRHLGRRPALEQLEDRTLLSTCHVNRLVDMGVGKGFRGDFRYCLTKANADPGEDLIIFGVQGTINLNGALPAISDDLIIAGPGADQLTLRRDTGGEYRIFTIPEGVNVQIYSVTMTNGSPGFITKPKDRWGGGIYNSGTLTLGNVAVVGNIAPSPGGLAGHGGGIFNDGVLRQQSRLGVSAPLGAASTTSTPAPLPSSTARFPATPFKKLRTPVITKRAAASPVTEIWSFETARLPATGSSTHTANSRDSAVVSACGMVFSRCTTRFSLEILPSPPGASAEASIRPDTI